MSNFKFLLSDPGLVPYAEIAISAEKRIKVGNPAEPRQTGNAKNPWCRNILDDRENEVIREA